MRRAVLAIVLVGASAFGQDAQIVDGGVLFPETKVIELAQRIGRCESERDVYKAAAVETIHPVLLSIIVGVVAAGAGFGIGFGVAAAKK
jgi:hypothetical protein